MDDRLAKLKAWIESFGHKDVIPVRVTLNLTKTKTATFEGVRYFFRYDVRDHQGNIVQTIYDKVHSFYLLGDVPKQSMKRHFCFTLNGSDVFLAAYIMAPVKGWYENMHPFGVTFILKHWDEELTNSKIDTYEKRQYDRFPMEVEELKWQATSTQKA